MTDTYHTRRVMPFRRLSTRVPVLLPGTRAPGYPVLFYNLILASSEWNFERKIERTTVLYRNNGYEQFRLYIRCTSHLNLPSRILLHRAGVLLGDWMAAKCELLCIPLWGRWFTAGLPLGGLQCIVSDPLHVGYWKVAIMKLWRSNGMMDSVLLNYRML